MHDKALEAKILSLAGRAGIEGSRVYQVNKSVDTKTLNAYVAGLFGTKRIVLWDTTLKRMTDRELMFVMGHEMGHYVLHHVWQAIAFSALILARRLYVAYRSADAVIARYGGRLGVHVARRCRVASASASADGGLRPRGHAARAGVHAPCRARGGPLRPGDYANEPQRRHGVRQAAAGRAGQSAPGLLYKIFRESHPPLGERIDFVERVPPAGPPVNPWSTEASSDNEQPHFDRPRRRRRRRSRDGVRGTRAGGLQSGDLLKLRSVSGVEVSPDATRVAYTVDNNDGAGRPYGQLWVMTIADGKTRAVWRARRSRPGNPEWSPDSQWIAYRGRVGDKAGLVIAQARRDRRAMARGDDRHECPLPATDRTIAWAPDGKRIAFVSSVPGPEPRTPLAIRS